MPADGCANKSNGWDERFEAVAARIVADFIDDYEPERERCWIAEREGEPVGCVFLVRERAAEKTARLRLLHVEAAARGLGWERLWCGNARNLRGRWAIGGLCCGPTAY